MKKTGSILITGAAGFIGSNLSRRLIDLGYKVSGLDNLSYGSLDNLGPVLPEKNFRFIKGDTRDQNLVSRLIKDIDCVVHLAAYKIPRYGGADKTLLVNSQGTVAVLEGAKRHAVKFILASTSDVYGKGKVLPFCEDADLVLGPSDVSRWSYAASKIFDEHLCLAYWREHKVPVVILRFFGAYGRNQNLSWWGGPQAVFISQALKGVPLTIHGDGRQTRSFTYVEDTVDGIIRAVENNKAVGGIFNIGSNEEISILGLARLIWRLTGRSTEPKFKFIPYSSFGKYEDVRRRIPDTRKSLRVLGFRARVKLEEGLLKVIAWQMNRI